MRGHDGGLARRAWAWVRSIAPEPWTLRTDAVAGVSGAVGSVPDGMAASVLVGVNPIHGLYASFAGRIAGGLSASTRLMVITTTSAAALAAGSALEGVAPASPGALFLLTVLAGVAMIVAGGIALGLIVVLARTRVATPGAGLATNGPPADARSPRGG